MQFRCWRMWYKQYPRIKYMQENCTCPKHSPWCNVSTNVTEEQTTKSFNVNLMFIGPCIIAIVDAWKTNLMSLASLFHLLCAQHVSDINIPIFRSLRLCCWITTLVVLFSVHCVLEFLLRLIFGGVRFAGWSTVAGSWRWIY